MRGRLILILAGAAAALAIAAAVGGLTRGGGGDAPPAPAVVPGAPEPRSDPLAWSPDRSEEYARRAADGLAHPLYTKVLGGIQAGTARTRAFRPQIEAAAARHDVDPATLEAIVLLESGGRPEAQASDDLSGAVGLTQILAVTAQELLGMHVDLAQSRRLTRRIRRAAERGEAERVARLQAQRRRSDERFDPVKSLEGTARYLAIAREHLERDDLAIASYHMGIGNVQTALARFGAGTVPYVRLFFGSTPRTHADAWRFLSSLGDDSATYLWRVEAAREILRQDREDPEALAAVARLQTARNSAEQLLHPPEDADVFSDPDALRDALDEGEVVALPPSYLAEHGVRIDPRMGELAARVDAEPALYRGLRREALATLAYIGFTVRQISGARTPLTVTSTVRDEEYQRRLARENIEAVADYSLHTTGWSFDIARDYGSRAQAMAFQFALDRLTALNLIAWVREPGAIHVTVSADAARLMAPMGVRADG